MSAPAVAAGADLAMTISDLEISTRTDDGFRPLVTGASLGVADGEIVGLVGESGSGKSMTALACLGLLPQGVEVTAGSVVVDRNVVTDASDEALRKLRGPHIGMVFQDPLTSLDPCFRIGRQLVEAIRAHESVSRASARRRAVDFLGHVGVPEPAQRFDAYPHELSGGLRQRVMIASALLLEPRVLIADEPTTALDVTTQASILALMHRLRDELTMSILWISHDLAVVAQLADRVAVMYAGEIVEVADTASLFSTPRHPYTADLLDCARHGEHGEPFAFIDGTVPESSEWPTGCRFAPRCGFADAVCATHPEMSSVGARGVRCHHPLPDGGSR